MNYFSSAVENCYSTIAIESKQLIDDDDIVGINCFDELLLRSEFISYARDNFDHEIRGSKLLFFSKRLNVYVYETDDNYAYLFNLNDDVQKELCYVDFLQIKSFKI